MVYFVYLFILSPFLFGLHIDFQIIGGESNEIDKIGFSLWKYKIIEIEHKEDIF